MTTKIMIPKLWEKSNKGFFFKGKFIGNTKKEAIDKLRENFNRYDDEEKFKKFPDEWKVITYEYEKSTAIINKIKERAKKTRELKKILTPEYKKSVERIKWLHRKDRYDSFLAKVLAQINDNKTNYELVNTRLNKLEEDIKSILAKLYVER